jgi:hypothetical protein
MNDLIQSELHEVLDAWFTGRRIHAIALGHPTRIVPPVHGLHFVAQHEERHVFRQRRTYDYCFSLIKAGLTLEGDKYEALTWDLFTGLTGAAPKDLSTEERQAAESLAWKALLRGWDRALRGFPEDHGIVLAREADA